ncbi:matrin-3-like isoform X1 [Solea senegalensis]|uniref:Matrin-3-like isoform X1 n=2 Tax=Solea senegalensis TaxID=28829 RepID=A0AAV6PJ66_SOLSE|nr:matrin-3-like isoform X1 [Solea senegalensis]
MSQRSQSDGQKHFAVGRGLLAAAETLNFSMNEQRSGRQMGGVASGVGVGGGMEGQDGSRRGGGGGGGGVGNNLGSTMKLFASLGLSPSDLDALAEIPEEEISVETLPKILRQLKNRKGDTGERRPASSMSSDAAYKGGRDGWEDMHMGRMGGPSLGQGSARAQTSTDFGFNSLQDVSTSRGYGLDYSSGGDDGGVGGSRERSYSELSHRDSYGGFRAGPPPSDSVFMQRRIGSPSNGKVQDFLGVTPAIFPHVCSLCDFDVHSVMEWNQHVNGLRHAENNRLLLNMYPDWDPGMSSGRNRGTLETSNMSPGILGPAPMSSHAVGGMSSSWGGGGASGPSGNNQVGQNKMRSRVVVAKFEQNLINNKALFAFTESFGVLREHVVLRNKAFLEMSSHEEAQDMVNYYDQHPALLHGKPITFYLSTRQMFIEKEDRSSNTSMDRSGREVKGQSSKVVFFSNLPREDDKKKELLTIAGRFGVVEKHLFLAHQAFVQLGTPQDAEMLVKYYSVNPLTIRGRHIRLNICTKYKTLTVNQRQSSAGDKRSPRSSSANNSSGSRTSSNSRTPSSTKSSSRTRDEDKKRKKEEEKKEEKAASEEEEVSGVMEGENEADGEGEEPGTDGDDKAEGAETVEEPVKESPGGVQEEQAPGDDALNAAPEPVGGAEGEAEQKAGPEGQTGPTEADVTTEEEENKEAANAESAESSEALEAEPTADTVDQEFMENMEDFVTLDEIQEDEDEELGDGENFDNTRKGGMRVVNIVGFRRGYNFRTELLGLADPFGEVVKHLVLDLRPEAYLQFRTEDEARAMAKFYNSNVTASVCGRPVRISHSMTYPTIQCGSSKVIYVGQLPTGKYADDDVLRLAQPYGNVRKYFLNRIKRECFIEMENAADAEKMAEDCRASAQKLGGKRLTIYVSRKYRQLKHGHLSSFAQKRENSSNKSSSKHDEEPPPKKQREETAKDTEDEGKEKKEEEDEEKEEGDVQTEVCEEKMKSSEELLEVKQEEEEPVEMSTNQDGQTEAPPSAENKPSAASLPLPPYDADTPVGVEHVKTGFYCRVCFLFYTNEDKAKKVHCSSQTHYDKLQKHLEKEEAKAEKKRGRKTTTTTS